MIHFEGHLEWAEQDQIAQLERKIGQQALEIDFLKGALQHLEEQRLLRALHTGAASTSKSTKKFKRGEGWAWSGCVSWVE